MPVPLAFLIFGVVIGLLLLLLRSPLSKKPIVKYGSAVILAGLLFWLLWSARNPLKKYGVDYRYAPTASSTQNSIEFFIASSKGEIEGPWVTGDELIVKFQDIDKTGIDDIVVTMDGRSDSRVVIRPLIKDGRATSFHIVENQSMCVGFRPEGYACP